MSYEETRRRLRLKYDKEYEEYIKRILSAELDIEDEKTLELLLDAYENDEKMKLLNEDFERLLARIEEERRMDRMQRECNRKEGVIF